MDRITVGDEGKALIKIRCCNMEKVNKYQLSEEYKICVFLQKKTGQHYIKECKKVNEWFNSGENTNKRIWKEYGTMSQIKQKKE